MDANQVFNIICEHINDVLVLEDDQVITPADSMVGLGANSIDRSEIIMMTLESLDLEIPLVDTFGPKNIGELSELLASKL
ncbi:acyl carrier protein [Alteromonas sp. a30]|uniref:acyl carrier protein n=1 Tax=Alteromonas sp. a30 TaxID=2730917 RepID=UPI00227F233D|nr:acyl carrier protein [Alteromonas sp. a30]MCY7297030.1 acyl carrier protein [Alteromonas sp. a30]